MKIDTAELYCGGDFDVRNVRAINALNALTGTEYNIVEVNVYKDIVVDETEPTFKEFLDSNLTAGGAIYRVKVKTFLMNMFNRIYKSYAKINSINDITIISKYDEDTLGDKIIKSFKRILYDSLDIPNEQETGIVRLSVKFVYIEYNGIGCLTNEDILLDYTGDSTNLVIRDGDNLAPLIKGVN